MRKFSVLFILCLALPAFGAAPERFVQTAWSAQPARPAQTARQAAPQVSPSLAPGPEEQYVLNMSAIYPAAHPVMQKVLRPWAESLLQESGGRLVIRIFQDADLIDPGKPGLAVRLGQVGLAVGALSAEPDDFRLSLLAAQGPGAVSLRALSAAYWRMYTEIPELAGEFAGIKLLAVYATDPFQLCVTGSPPYDAAALRGRRFLVESPLVAAKMDELGALATVLAQPDFKMYLEDRIADGVVLGLTDIARLGVGEHFQGVALGDLENGVIWLGLHQGVWEMLPPDLRGILTKASGAALSQNLGAAVEELYRAELERLGNGRVDLHYFSAEERGRFYGVMRSVAEEAWGEAAREGCNAKAVRDRIARILAETKAR